jgi:antitoxin component of MazEF toxin-antitoxin module
MEAFEATPKEWGNSLGITLPREVVKKENIAPKKKIKVIVIGRSMEHLKKAYGTLKFKKSTKQMMDEIDEGYD